VLLKRHWDVTPERGPRLKHVEVKHTGTHAEQNFSHRIVAAGLAEGWISLGRGTLTLHAPAEDLLYAILRMPGRYCLHCDHYLADDGDRGVKLREHVSRAHAGAVSPDPATPAGYVWLTYYECRLDAAQHAKFKVVSRG
jgi:hypothetical protein